MKRRIEIESLKRKTGYLVNALFCARVLRVSKKDRIVSQYMRTLRPRFNNNRNAVL